MNRAAPAMTSPLLALFVRSLREDVRLKMTYAARAGLVLVVGVFMIFAVIASGWRGAPGLNFFAAIVHIQTLFITLAGMSYFASAITEEKEENMLGLLRMTELDPLSILLGKSTSRLCGALLLLAAQFPFTLLAVTLGGVTARQIVAAYLALGAYTFFLCNLALLASVVSRRTGNALALVGGALVMLWSLPTVFSWLGFLGPPWLWLSEGLEIASTSFRLSEILSTGFDGALLGTQLLFNVGAGVGCFVAAWMAFDRCAVGDTEASVSGGRWPWRRRFPPGRVWPRPLVWKDVHFIHGGRGVILLKSFAYTLALAGFMIARLGSVAFAAFTGTNPSFGLITAGDIASACLTASWFAGIALLGELGLAASRLFSVEVRERTLSSLILLPITLRELHRAKVQSCYHAVLPVVCHLVLCLTGAAIAGINEHPSLAPVVLIVAFATCAFVFALAHVLLLFHLVAWLSLKVPHGAFPLGIAILVTGGMVAGVMGMITFGLALVASPFVAVILSGVCQTRLLQRLETITSEE